MSSDKVIIQFVLAVETLAANTKTARNGTGVLWDAVVLHVSGQVAFACVGLVASGMEANVFLCWWCWIRTSGSSEVSIVRSMSLLWNSICWEEMFIGSR